MRTASSTPAPPAPRGTAPEPARVTTSRAERVAYLDRLKLVLVAVIIAGHGALTYSDIERAWPYQEVQEVTLSEPSNIVLGVLVLPAALFTMGLFFLISGRMTPPSLARKGTRRFVRERLVRLGLPLAIWVLAIWPLMILAAHRAAGESRSYWTQIVHADPFLDTGPMWFVEVLLVYSLGYAAWCASAGRRPRAPAADRVDCPRPLSGRTLVALAAGISLATMLVRLVFPLTSPQPAHPNLWQWPQYLGMFGLGILAARRGWLEPVPRAIARRCGAAALLGLLAFGLLGAAMAASGVDPDVLAHERLHWATMALAAIEGPLAVGASVWLLAASQRRLGHPLGRRGRALARSAFAAFILQGAVLIGLAIALRPIDVPAEAKAAAVALGGTAASFGLAWLLVARTPLGRVL